MIDERLLKSEEKAVFALRSLYRRYGYLPYKMSKFEEYELYLRNKDFLVSDRVITFNDTNGRLMALKPDVTLSIIKNGEDLPGYKQKVYYNENVYRVSDSTHRYKEIMQTGLECIGDIDLYDVYEVITLAAESLATVSDAFVLEISQLDLLSQTLDAVCTDKAFGEEALRCIAEKNAHDLRRLCARRGVSPESCCRLETFITACGERTAVIRALEALGDSAALRELKTLSAMLDASPYSDRIRLDFSVVNDMNYYNGFVFKGFLDGISSGVLAGGRYDKMMARMNRRSGAIGFALYLDLLEQLRQETPDYDADVLLLYDDSSTPAQIAGAVEQLTAQGLLVKAAAAGDDRFRCRETRLLRNGGMQE